MSIAQLAAPIIGAGMGLLLEGHQDNRQEKQQGKLQKQQIAGNKEMSEFEKKQQMDIWERTNYKPQVDQMKKAGLNPGLLYGMGGGGGATTGGGAGMAVTGGQAETGAKEVGMGLQSAAQLALLGAQKENIEADTANKKAGTEKTGVETAGSKIDVDTKEKTQDSEIQRIKEAGWEQVAKTANEATKQKINEETQKHQIRSIQEKMINDIMSNKILSKENKIKEAELSIKEFEAKMAESGIDPKTPWYIKLITDIAEKHGLNILK